MSWSKSLVALMFVLGLGLTACSSDATGSSSTRSIETTAPAETTSTIAVTTTTTTTTAPSTTTTTMPAVESSTIIEAFRTFFDRVVAKDYDGARQVSSGAAADYATFTEDLNAISSQPDWQFDSGSEASSLEAVAIADGRFGTDTALSYTEANGGELAVSNPVVVLTGAQTLLDEWGVDLATALDQPALGQRLKSIARSPEADPSGCLTDGLWAYVPGGSDTSAQVRIIAIGRACDVNGDLTPKAAESRLYADDGSVDVTASTFLLEGGGDRVPVNTPLRYLAIFDIPSDAASSALIWDTPFDRSNVPATTFLNFEIGPFDLS